MENAEGETFPSEENAAVKRRETIKHQRERLARLQRLSGVFASSSTSSDVIPCPICLEEVPTFSSITLSCNHATCISCMEQYVQLGIQEGRTEFTCPNCPEAMDATTIQALVPPEMFERFMQFSLERYLSKQKGARRCPAPNCGYALILESEVNEPPAIPLVGTIRGMLPQRAMTCKGERGKLICGNAECKQEFCYRCSKPWHPGSSCEMTLSLEEMGFTSDVLGNARVKPCPNCRTPIDKIDDGSCNHVKCFLCGTDFCWLCMREISELHYFSPSGCTLFAKKPWSQKKKFITQVSLGLTAPAIIGVLAAAAVPTILFGLPIAAARKTSHKLKDKATARMLLVGPAAAGALVAAPLVAALSLGVGVPSMFIVTYIVMPHYLIKESINNKRRERALRAQLKLPIDQ